MRNIKEVLLSCVVICLLSSCEGDGVPLGEVRYYPSFLWVDEDITPVTKTVDFDFSQDAKDDESTFAEFQFVDNDGNPISTNEMQVFVDGKQLVNNTILIKSDVTSIEFLFKFTPTAEEGKHQGYLKLISHKLERLNSKQLMAGQTVEAFQWTLNYDKLMNPLAKLLICIVVTILICLAIWFIFIRPIKYPKFGGIVKNISINGNIRKVVFKGYRQVVLCKQRRNQSTWNKLFMGKILYVENSILLDDIIFTPQMRRGKNIGAIISVFGKNKFNYRITPNPMPKTGNTQIINQKNNITINL